MDTLPRYAVWLLLAIVVYGALSWLAHQSLYYPLRYPRGQWEMQRALGAVDVTLQAAGGTMLHGWWVAAPSARVATLHLHGNAGNVTHRAQHAGRIVRAGSSVLLLDYRGYGKSGGKPNESGLYQDADAGYEYLLAQGWHPRQIVVHGESLGTSVAVDLAARRECAGLVLEAPFPSAREVAGSVVPYLGKLLVWGFDAESKIRRVRVPLLIIHGDRDEIIPFELGRKLFDAANEPKSFWTVPGAGHNDIVLVAGLSYQQRLASFYSSILP